MDNVEIRYVDVTKALDDMRKFRHELRFPFLENRQGINKPSLRLSFQPAIKRTFYPRFSRIETLRTGIPAQFGVPCGLGVVRCPSKKTAFFFLMIESSSLDIPKQYDPHAAQKKWAKFWDESGFFHSDPARGQAAGKKPYSIVIPPPNVTGALHMGHALNNTLQDIMIRMKRMQGFETLWVPGVDHAGIATQAVVERKLFEDEKLTRHDIGREALVARIWQWKDQYQARIITQLKEMGCSCDWTRTRFTLDEVCAKAVRHFFFKLFEQNLIYRGKRLVNWDTLLQTAVSDDEVFHETVDGHFWYIKYPVIDPQPGEPEFVVVATTRPETMLGDTAVAVHPDPEGQMQKIIAECEQKLATASEKDKPELQKELDELNVQYHSETHDVLITLAQMAKDGRELLLPLANRPIPLVADNWAKPEKGTGCVKITPAHDPNDYEVGLRQKLPMINILCKNGTLNENAGEFAGLTIKKAREAAVQKLEELGLLLAVEDRMIEQAHSDRSKTPIEPFLNDQWFVKMDTLAQVAMESVEKEAEGRVQCSRKESGKVRITPSRYTKTYLDWLGEKRDWPSVGNFGGAIAFRFGTEKVFRKTNCKQHFRVEKTCIGFGTAKKKNGGFVVKKMI